MTPLTPDGLDRFARQYRWPGGRLRRLRFTHRRGSLTVEMVLRVRRALRDLAVGAKPVSLRLSFESVEECRFQKRPAKDLDRIADVRFGFFEGLIFVSFDAWPLGPGDRPAVFDFRGSDAYLAAPRAAWAELEPVNVTG